MNGNHKCQLVEKIKKEKKCMKQQEINVTLENYDDVVSELKKKVDQLSAYEEEFSEWTTSELMSYSEDDAPGMMLQALE